MDEAIGLPLSLSLDYLKGTKKISICNGKGNLNVHGYCDSDVRKYTYAYIYTVVGGAISWCSKLQ